VPENNKTEPHDSPKHNKDKKDSQRGLWIIIGVGIAVLLIVIIVGAVFVDSQKIRFITEFSLTVALATLVGVQAYIYRKQWDAMERQGKAMQDGLERTDKVIDKMEAQSEILRKQAKSMDESVVFGLRAYVGIHSIGINFLTNRLHIQVENIGRVPAKDVRVDVQMEVAIPPKCMPEGYDLSLGAYVFTTKLIPFHYGEAKLFPGNLNINIIIPIKRWLSEGLSDEQIHLITQGDARLIVRGNINFCDGFNADKNTPFALRFSPQADCWLPHPILSPEKARRASEEQPYYEE